MLKVSHLSSGYRKQPVIHNLSFEVPKGQITALIGLNGAGKSTLLKTILGLLEVQSGQIEIDGENVRRRSAAYAKKIAYVPETPILYEELTLKEHLQMTALGYQIDEAEVNQRAQPLLELFRLDQHLDWFPVHFSKGMKQKVMLVCALVTDADLLIVDEPFLGLDPLAIRQLTDLLEERVAQGTSVLMTTHVLSIAEKICSNYLFLHQGHLLAQGDLAAINEAFGQAQPTLESLYFDLVEKGGDLIERT